MFSFRLIAAVVAASVSTSTIAAPLALYPVQSGAETARFRQGVPTLDLETPQGALQITPLPFDHGYASFGIGFYNKGTAPVNVGIENIAVTSGDQTLKVFTREDLQSKAKNWAMWSQIGVAMVAAGAAYAASKAYTTQTVHSSTYTPFGAVHSVTAWRDNSIGTLGATAAAASGVAGIVGIQNRLDYTLDNLAEEIVQTTTVDPEASYGGRIVIAKPEKLKPPYDIRLTFAVGGVDYPFVFRITPQGQNLPAAYTVAVAPIPAPLAAPEAAAAPAVLVAPAVGSTAASGPSAGAPLQAAPASVAPATPVTVTPVSAPAQPVTAPAAQTDVLTKS